MDFYRSACLCCLFTAASSLIAGQYFMTDAFDMNLDISHR